MTVRYLLDTDTCVAWLRQHAGVYQQIQRVTPAALAIAVITVAELRFGAACSQQPERHNAAIDHFIAVVPVLGLDLQAAQLFGTIKASLRRSG